MYKDTRYESSEYRMPNQKKYTFEEKQTAEYASKCIDYFYSSHLRNKTSITFNEQQKYNVLRLYLAGNQPQEWYKDWLSGGKAPSNYGIDNFWPTTRRDARKGYMNIDWAVVSLMPKIVSMVLPIIKNIDYNISIDCIDPLSGSEEEDRMVRSYVRTLFGKSLDFIAQQNDIPIQTDDITGTYKELEIIKAEGGFKAEHTLEMTKLIKWIEQISLWDEFLYENLILDFLAVGSVAALEDFDYETRTSKWHYVNPSRIICQSSERNDMGDVDYIGYEDKIRISELEQIFPEVKREEWVGLAKKHIGYESNPENYEQYESFLVPYLRMYWIETNTDKYVEHNTLNGKKILFKKDKQTLLGNGKNIFDHNWRTMFEAKKVIGTDYVWDYGQMKNQSNPTKRNPVFPLKVYKSSYKSITERLIPIMNSLQITWLKYQNAMMTAFPGGIAVDINMISNISDGNKKYPFMDIIKMMFEKGFLPYKLSLTGQYQGGGVSPVQQIPSDLISKLNEYLTIISGCLKFVEDITGLSAVALGSTPSKDQQVGTTELSYSATMNSLKHIVDGCRIIKQGLANVSADRLRIYSEVDPETRKVHESIIGKRGLDMILAAKKQLVQYGAKAIARPQDTMKQLIFDTIEKAYAKYVNKQPGINEGQRIRIVALIEGGMDLSYAGQVIEAWIAQSEKKLIAEAERNSASQGQVQQSLQAQKTQDEMNKLKGDTESEIMIDTNKAKVEGDKEIRVEAEKRKNIKIQSNSEYEKMLLENDDEGRKT